MATDKSEPRVGLIVKVGLLSIVTLFAVHAALVSYFDAIAQAEEQRKVGEIKPEALDNLRQSEHARLSSGPVPIQEAMHELASRGRNVNPQVMPTASKDLTPLQGWHLMPQSVPTPMTASPEPAPSAAPDGGGGAAAAQTTKGARPQGDAGAPRALPKK